MSVLTELDNRLDLLRNKRDQINEEIASIHKDMKQNVPAPRNMKNVLFPIVRDFNVVIDNSIICDTHEEIIMTIFGQELIIFINGEPTIYDILVSAGAFESKGQARKNWQGIKKIPVGYSEIGPIGKGKLFLFVWNPSE